MLNCLTTCVKNRSAIAEAPSVPSPTEHGHTLTNFVKRSTQVKIALKPETVGNEVMKSIL